MQPCRTSQSGVLHYCHCQASRWPTLLKFQPWAELEQCIYISKSHHQVERSSENSFDAASSSRHHIAKHSNQITRRVAVRDTRPWLLCIHLKEDRESCYTFWMARGGTIPPRRSEKTLQFSHPRNMHTRQYLSLDERSPRVSCAQPHRNSLPLSTPHQIILTHTRRLYHLDNILQQKCPCVSKRLFSSWHVYNHVFNRASFLAGHLFNMCKLRTESIPCTMVHSDIKPYHSSSRIAPDPTSENNRRRLWWSLLLPLPLPFLLRHYHPPSPGNNLSSHDTIQCQPYSNASNSSTYPPLPPTEFFYSPCEIRTRTRDEHPVLPTRAILPKIVLPHLRTRHLSAVPWWWLDCIVTFSYAPRRVVATGVLLDISFCRLFRDFRVDPTKGRRDSRQTIGCSSLRHNPSGGTMGFCLPFCSQEGRIRGVCSRRRDFVHFVLWGWRMCCALIDGMTIVDHIWNGWWILQLVLSDL